MNAAIDVLNPDQPKRILMVASNPATSTQTGWPIGFWWAELTHPYWEFTEHGYRVDFASPDGGEIRADAWSDPRDASGYSAHDLISLGFISSPTHASLLTNTARLQDVRVDDYDAVLFVGGQGPMYTFIDNESVQTQAAAFYEAGKIVGVICHATCLLLKTRLSNGKTWTGFANAEEDAADTFVGQKIQPFRIENKARALPGTSFIVQRAFKPFAIRDGRLITGQQQFSGTAAARLMIEALGV
jgi:putative intracellular protease/amidase